MYLLRLIIGFLLIVFLTLPARAQNLWNIYRKNEEVKLVLETIKILDNKQLSTYMTGDKGLTKLLGFNLSHTLEPMFPRAPSREEAIKIYGFKPKYDLRTFYILTFSSNEEILGKYESPFHYADELRKASSDWGELAMKSVEPDLPLFSYPIALPQSSSDCPDKEHSSKDLAWSLRNMKVPQAWQFSKKEGRSSEGFGVKIGHPDTGYSDHTDLDEIALIKNCKNNFIEKNQMPKDPLKPSPSGLKQQGHGTATGSVIISRGDVTAHPPGNTEGGTKGPGKVTGVASKAKLVPYRAINSVIRFTYGNIEKAMYKSVKDGCSIISLSLGGTGHSALNAVMEHAIGNNVIVVAAAGNFSWWPVVYPARYPFCIAVAATNDNNKPWKNSAHGDEVDVSAPGESVWRAFRTKPNESTKVVEPSCGTSYSTANVAGVAALWLAHYKRPALIKQFNSVTKLQFVFKNLIKETAICPSKDWDKEYGAGIVNAENLLKENPDTVRNLSIDDFKKFTEKERESAESNLEENRRFYNKYFMQEYRGHPMW